MRKATGLQSHEPSCWIIQKPFMGVTTMLRHNPKRWTSISKCMPDALFNMACLSIIQASSCINCQSNSVTDASSKLQKKYADKLVGYSHG
jgi:hypothetical protein